MHQVIPFAGVAEPVSCWTHLVGAFIFICVSIYLVRSRLGSRGKVLAPLVFTLSCVMLLAVSGVYHLLPRGGDWRWLFQRLDHAAIYVLIAGTFTAVHFLSFEGRWRWGMIFVAWFIALCGIALKTVFFADIPEWLGLTSYLAFGWLGIASGVALFRRYGFDSLKPLLYGGVAYSLGAILDFSRRPVLIEGVVGSHELFHLAVLLGISFHWSFISARVKAAASPVLHH